jgi:hypothetical protein|tara:strand:+ start:472 stop:720 length:249 start_codon:yes stop_codon:yes gene_type:complete
MSEKYEYTIYGCSISALEGDMKKAKKLGNTNLGGEYLEKVKHVLEMLLSCMKYDLRTTGPEERLSGYIARAEVLEQEVLASA